MSNLQEVSGKDTVRMFLVLALMTGVVGGTVFYLTHNRKPHEEASPAAAQPEAKVAAPEADPKSESHHQVPAVHHAARHAPTVARTAHPAPAGEPLIQTVSRGSGGAPAGVSGTNVSYGASNGGAFGPTTSAGSNGSFMPLPR
jgi:hypothetical protein